MEILLSPYDWELESFQQFDDDDSDVGDQVEGWEESYVDDQSKR